MNRAIEIEAYAKDSHVHYLKYQSGLVELTLKLLIPEEELNKLFYAQLPLKKVKIVVEEE